jgi:hypothetical protein
MKNKIFLGFIAVFLVWMGCKKVKTYPDIPSIEFRSLGTYKSVIGLDSASEITISFIDGDGDVGLYPSGNGNPFDDSLSIYYDNFYCFAYRRIGGEWVKDNDTANFLPNGLPSSCGRLPYMTSTGLNKTLKGEISMSQPIWTFPIVSDTIYYEVYIVDRALNKSNTITTPAIVIHTF